MPKYVEKRFRELSGPYRSKGEWLILTSDQYPTQAENRFHIKRTLRLLIAEAYKADHFFLSPTSQPLDAPPGFEVEPSGVYTIFRLKDIYTRKKLEEQQKQMDEIQRSFSVQTVI